MGFLFDEDLVENAPGGQGRVEAMSLWADLMGELEAPAAAAIGDSQSGVAGDSTSGSLSVQSTVPELLLDDVAAVDLPEIALVLEDELEPIVLESPVPPPARQQLSKFRNASSASDRNTAVQKDRSGQPSPRTEGGSELGRIPLVRVRREGAKRVPFLARLLSSF
jgi:hypothetical protein